jgi:hypothetical protein
MKSRLLFVLTIVFAFMLAGVAPGMSDDTQPKGNTPTATTKAQDTPASMGQSQGNAPTATTKAQDASAPMDQSGEPPMATQPKPAQPASVAPKSDQTAQQQGGIQIQDAVICQNVVNREPVDSGDVFPKEISKVFCYFRVVGASGESSVTANWYYKGTLKATVQLPVRSPNWRTWTSKSMKPEWTGEWMVEILSSEGTPLGNISFAVK